MYRRQFLHKLAAVALVLTASPLYAVTNRPKGFFSLQQRGDRWWMTDPSGKLFFSLALNHIDPATLMYAENIHIWRDKYGNSMKKWLRQVGKDIRKWNFNSVGWVQEVVLRNNDMHRHSDLFTYEEYQWLGMPYCHRLPFAEFHHWDTEHRHPPLFTSAFEDWCDYVARRHCSRFAEDPALIGYFYIDCPAWIHHKEKNAWKGALADPAQLYSEAGRREIHRMATRYYQVTHDAVRRYDPHHLILGDRYEANNPISETVIRAAAPFIDVLSFQHFDTADAIAENMHRYHRLTGKPTLLADFGVPDHDTWEQGFFAHRTDQYRSVLRRIRESVPQCVGLHFCGAYMRNKTRKYGLLDRLENQDDAFAEIAAENELTLAWIRDARG